MGQEILQITGIQEYKNSLTDGKVYIATSGNVWPPYSAFHLAEKTFPLAKRTLQANNDKPPLIVDIGTGSGVLAIMAKQNFPNIHCLATDLNPEAVKLTKHNWILNNLPPDHLTTMEADGISSKLTQLLQTRGKADILLANLPQQPLVNSLDDLASLRKTNPAAWNIDPSRDPDGLGIFKSVLANAYQIMRRPGGIALVSASSKQNWARIKAFLNSLVGEQKAIGWSIVSETIFDVPRSYDPLLLEHWRKRQEQDGVPRIFVGPQGQPQYKHYNLIIYY